MKENQDFKYILFPLPLLQEVFQKPKNGIERIFDYGIYRVSQTIECSTEDALLQLSYCYIRSKNDLSTYLTKQINGLIKKGVLNFSEDDTGFHGDTYEPIDDMVELIKYCDKNDFFKDQVIEFYKLRRAKKVLNMTYGIEHIAKEFGLIQEEYGEFKGMPLVSLKVDLMFDYYRKEKDEFSKAVFCMYGGIKSILGDKKFTGTTREMITCRMFGLKSNKEIESLSDKPKVKSMYEKYSKRYHFEKVFNYLLNNNFLKSKIAVKRRTYISCVLSSEHLEEAIIRHLTNKNRDFKTNERNIKELQAKNRILQHLNK